MKIFVFFRLFTVSIAAKVIFNGMHSSDSHILSMIPLAIRLSEENHTIHVLETNTKSTHFKYPASLSFTHIELRKDPFFVDYTKAIWTKMFGPLEFPHIWKTGDKAFVEMLQYHSDKIGFVFNQTWDLVIADELFSVSSYALAISAQRKGKPFITMSTSIPTNLIKYHLSLGTPFALRPSMYHRVAEPYEIERFAHRFYATVQETWKALRTQYVTSHIAVQGLHKVGIFDFDISQLAKYSSNYFLDDITSIVYPSPVSTGLTEVGFHCSMKKQLPDDYMEFVDDISSKGTILVSFGSNVVWDYAPDDFVNITIEALNRLSQYRIVFSYNGVKKRASSFGKHIKTSSWVPQKEILQHNKTVLFISHGGLKSVKETICGGIPALYIPLFAEQAHNGEMARSAGFAEALHKQRLSADIIEKLVQNITDTPRYKMSAQRIRKFYLDRIISSLDLAEFIARRSIKTSPRAPLFKRKGMFISLFSHIYFMHFVMLILMSFLLYL